MDGVAIPQEEDDKRAGMMGLIRELLRPYRGSLAIILAAMIVQSAMTLAAPWPLKIILDNVVVGRRLDSWMARLLEPLLTPWPPRTSCNAGGACRGHHRHFQRPCIVPRQLLHRERGPVGGQRSPHADLPSSAISFVALLRHPPVRRPAEHDYRRRAHHPKLRFVGHPGHCGRYDHHPGHAGDHVLHELGLYLDRGRSDAIAAVAGLPVQEGGQEVDPRSTQAAEQYRGGGTARSRIHPRGHRPSDARNWNRKHFRP